MSLRAEQHAHAHDQDRMRLGLDAFAELLRTGRFEVGQPTTTLTIELKLVDGDTTPARHDPDRLQAIAGTARQAGLGRFDLEIRSGPRTLSGAGLSGFHRDLRAGLTATEAAARRLGVHPLMVGIVPTARRRDLDHSTVHADPGYAGFNEQIFTARGGTVRLDIIGEDRLTTRTGSIIAEAVSAGTRLDVRLGPAQFPLYWNAAQALAGVQVALGANSPVLLGRRLWHETRVPLIEQGTIAHVRYADDLSGPGATGPGATDGVRPQRRAWFGEKWITSVLDLLRENIGRFPALRPGYEMPEPADAHDVDGAPELAELGRHNATVHRWNHPAFDVTDGRARLRLENRVLPAGPTVADTVANAAFYLGVLRALAEADSPVWSQMSFSAAVENFHAGARDGIEARIYWPGLGYLPVADVVLRHLLPMAHSGLDRWGVDPADRDRMLAVIEKRCLTGQTGAVWQVRALQRLESWGDLERRPALREVVRRYLDHMSDDIPVHEWPLD